MELKQNDMTDVNKHYKSNNNKLKPKQEGSGYL